MKMKTEHFNYLKETIDASLESNPGINDRYQANDFKNADKCTDKNVRFRWDILHMAGLTPWICKELYNYLNDSHIDTALKNIVPVLK